MNKKIAIYGGAFNPPTLGHSHVIKQVLNYSEIEKIIVVPDGLRLDKKYNISKKHRDNLIKIFIKDMITLGYNIELDNYFSEGHNNTNTTTYQVDKYFINKLGIQPYHIFGTDVISGFKDWTGNPDKYIQKKLKKIFIPRKGYIFNNLDLENYKLLNTTTELDVSSTKIKENINKKIKIDKLVIKDIEKYIKNNNLY